MTEDIAPPLLGAKFESKLVTIPSQVLEEWCHAHPLRAAESAESEVRLADLS